MKRHLSILAVVACGYMLLVSAAESDESIPSRSGEATGREPSRRSTLKVARDRAKLLAKVYTATLEVLHDRYFHGARAIVPARAMEDIFAEIKQDEQIEARWIAVSLKAMSINHEAKSDFEKFAVQQIKAGKRDVERVDDSVYRRAVAIPLRGGCINCHDNSFMPSTTAGFAGLVISIPIREADGMDEPSPTK